MAPLAIRTSFRSDLSEDGDEDNDVSAVISEKEWGIQERTRERMDAMRQSHAESDVLRDGEGEAREGASVDWDIATSDEWAEELMAQKVAWLERGAHHAGSPTVPLLLSPEDAMLAGCGRLVHLAGCEWIEPMVRNGTLRPKVESGSRITLEVVPLGVFVSVEFSEGVRFSAGEKEFADAKETEAWLREITAA